MKSTKELNVGFRSPRSKPLRRSIWYHAAISFVLFFAFQLHGVPLAYAEQSCSPNNASGLPSSYSVYSLQTSSGDEKIAEGDIFLDDFTFDVDSEATSITYSSADATDGYPCETYLTVNGIKTTFYDGDPKCPYANPAASGVPYVTESVVMIALCNYQTDVTLSCPGGNCPVYIGAECPAGDVGTAPNCACPADTVATVSQQQSYAWAPTSCAAEACSSIYADTTGTYPDCACASGYVGSPGDCQLAACSSHYPDTVGTYPSCACAAGYVGSPGSCSPETCADEGSNVVGTYPSCACASGYVGTPGSCTPEICADEGSNVVGTYPSCECAAGYHGTPGSCVATTCGYLGENGTYPNCYTTPAAVVAPTAVCPAGSSGVFPDCTPVTVAAPTVDTTCPAGETGTPPNCVASTCPDGETGAPPNCVASACPSGETGTPPNCVAAQQDACPSGFTGTPPNCVQTAAAATPTDTPTDTASTITETNLSHAACEALSEYQINPDQVGVSVNGSSYSPDPLTTTESSSLCMQSSTNTVTWKIQ